MMDIVISLDKNYLMPAGVMLYSLFENNKEDSIIVHALLGYDGNQCEKPLADICNKYQQNIHFYYMNMVDFTSMPVNLSGQRANISLASYYRLFVSDVLPDTIHKVLYLDCDMIICQSLRDLWNENMTDWGLAAVPDLHHDNVHFTNRLQYDVSDGYFNGGLLLINLDYWRSNHMKEMFVNYIAEQYDSLYFHDQDVLNYFFHDSKKELPIKWNFQTVFLWKDSFCFISCKYHSEIEESYQNPGIIHYTEDKPWYKNSPNPMKEYFYKYRDMTEWKGRDKGHRPVSLKNRVMHLFVCIKRRKMSFYRSNYDEQWFVNNQ